MKREPCRDLTHRNHPEPSLWPKGERPKGSLSRARSPTRDVGLQPTATVSCFSSSCAWLVATRRLADCMHAVNCTKPCTFGLGATKEARSHSYLLSHILTDKSRVSVYASRLPFTRGAWEGLTSPELGQTCTKTYSPYAAAHGGARKRRQGMVRYPGRDDDCPSRTTASREP